MLDIGWSELILIGVIALIVVGPKDLPEMFRTLGRFTAKAKSMAREFSSAMSDMAKEAQVDDVARDLRNITSPKALGLDAVKNAATKFESWDPMKTVKLKDQPTTASAKAVSKPAPVPEPPKPVVVAPPVPEKPQPKFRRKLTPSIAPARRGAQRPLPKKKP